MKKIPTEVKTGVLFLLAIGVFIWGFNFLKGTNIFGHKRILYAVYDRVDGLEPMNKVKVNGLNIGQVSRLDFVKGSSKIFVELYIQSDIPIPANSIARIYSTDLLGGKAIEIILGDSAVMAKSGDTLRTMMEQSLREQVTEQVEPIRKRALALINSMDTLLVNIQGIFNPESQDNITSIFENIRITITTLKNSMTTVDEIITTEQNRIDRILSNLERITTNLKDNNQQISNIIRNISSISDTLNSAELSQTIRDLRSVSENLSKITEKLKEGEGTMGQLFQNDTLYFNLQKATENLNRLLEDIRMNPRRYMKVSVF